MNCKRLLKRLSDDIDGQTKSDNFDSQPLLKNEHDCMSGTTRESDIGARKSTLVSANQEENLLYQFFEEDINYMLCLDQDNMKSPQSETSRSQLVKSISPRDVTPSVLELSGLNCQENECDEMELLVQRMKLKETVRMEHQRKIM
jgi:hypothetical protein